MDYSEAVIDHAKSPRNFGDLPKATHEGKGSNATCGDMVEFYLIVDNGKVKEAKFRGVGCALSTAMASMLTEKVVGMKVGEVKKMDKEIVEELMGEVNPARMKCVLLPVETMRSIME